MRGAALTCMATLLLAGPAALGQPPLPTTWVVTGDQAIEGLPLVLTGDVVVGAGGALRLRGVEALAAALPGRGVAITVQAGGLLELGDGLEAVTQAPRPTRLAGIIGAAPFDLRVEEGGALRAFNVTIQDARIALAGHDVSFVDSHLNATAATIRVTGGSPEVRGGLVDAVSSPANPPKALFWVDGGALTVDGATLRGGGTGATVLDGAGLVLRNATVEATALYALDVEHAWARVEGTRFASSSEYALYAVGADLEVRGSTFTTDCGAFLLGGTTGILEDNRFAAASRGLTLSAPGPLRVANNTFAGASLAVRLADGGAPALEGNVFEDNGRAVQVDDTAAGLHDNVFRRNAEGVAVGGAAPGAPLPVLRGNDFDAHGAFALRNDLPAAVDARHNWWGAAAGPNTPGAGAALGTLDLAPWLAAAP